MTRDAAQGLAHIRSFFMDIPQKDIREILHVAYREVTQTLSALREYDEHCMQAKNILESCPSPTLPQVRPLVWVKHPTAEIWRCYTIIGQYMVFAISAPTWDFDGIKDRTTRTALNETEAKAAAQADYTRRILSALA